MFNRIGAWIDDQKREFRQEKIQRKKEKEKYKAVYKEERLKQVEKKAQSDAKKKVFQNKNYGKSLASKMADNFKSGAKAYGRKLVKNADEARKQGSILPMNRVVKSSTPKKEKNEITIKFR